MNNLQRFTGFLIFAITLVYFSSCDLSRSNLQGVYVLEVDDLINNAAKSFNNFNNEYFNSSEMFRQIGTDLQGNNISLELGKKRVKFNTEFTGELEYSYTVKGDTLYIHDSEKNRYLIKEDLLISIDEAYGYNLVFRKISDLPEI